LLKEYPVSGPQGSVTTVTSLPFIRKQECPNQVISNAVTSFNGFILRRNQIKSIATHS
jgi:hypothetical protein